MSTACTVRINDESINVRRGDILLDAALAGGIDIPHDCRAGQCGSCRVRVVEGQYWGGDFEDGGVVHACQCRVISDLSIELEKTPDVMETSGHVAEINRLSPNIVEVCVKTTHPVEFLPGQYYSVRFAGFPARCYSPTTALDWPSKPGLVRFQIRQVPNGLVSSALTKAIKPGGRVKITGPYGSAYFRPEHPGRLILVSSGTGFAPIWSIAERAIRERPDRDMHIIVGGDSMASLYMIPALCRIAKFPNVTITPTLSQPQKFSKLIRTGFPQQFLPELNPDDIVYVAGSPILVSEVNGLARAARVPCYSDAFVPQQHASASSAGKVLRWIAEQTSKPSLALRRLHL
jgi:3-phenylpropionate/trans-cinnamate dioxygenase ferredoxin reductase subunit